MHFARSVRSAFAVTAITMIAGAAELAQNPNVHAALDRISPQSMRGHVSFLASDLLEGRATPSPGLDVAAEYIAAQFRRAGLEPAGDNGYFQTAKYLQFEADKHGAKVELDSGGKRIAADVESLRIQVTGPVSLDDTPVLKFASDDLARIEQLKHADVEDKVVAFYLARSFGQGGYRTYSAVRRLRPALLIVVGPGVPRQGRTQLIAADSRDSEPSVVAIREGEFVNAIEHAKPGSSDLKVTVHLSAPRERTVLLRNVAAIVRGSDPVLKDTYLLVTAHYDHVGVKTEGDGDRIYNGANDDASGTASVIEIASALAAMDPRPKRSIVFVALFGEELGLLGSQHYGRHPLFPLDKTIGDINLEHMGRTDANDGPKVASASFTGFDYSGLPAAFQKAGEQVGVNVYKDEKRSDSFFARSDNQALADLGIPAHTLCVAFEFPDYHGVGDEWPKIDYDNMAKVDRMVALGLVMIGNSEAPPKWDETHAKVKPYAEAWRALHPEATH
jgi:hypothetical protein